MGLSLRQAHDMDINEIKYALFASEDKYNAGALAQGPFYKPSADGVLIYLNGGDNIEVILSRVGAAAGTVIMPKMLLSEEAGYIGMFIDSEGNRIGVQSVK